MTRLGQQRSIGTCHLTKSGNLSTRIGKSKAMVTALSRRDRVHCSFNTRELLDLHPAGNAVGNISGPVGSSDHLITVATIVTGMNREGQSCIPSRVPEEVRSALTIHARVPNVVWGAEPFLALARASELVNDAGISVKRQVNEVGCSTVAQVLDA